MKALSLLLGDHRRSSHKKISGQCLVDALIPCSVILETLRRSRSLENGHQSVSTTERTDVFPSHPCPSQATRQDRKVL